MPSTSPKHWITTGLASLLFMAALTAPITATATTPPAPPPILAAWTQLASGTDMSIRAIVQGTIQAADCPTVTGGQSALNMTLRAGPEAGDPGDFPNTVCEVSLPRDATSRTVGGFTVPGVPTNIDSVTIMGDTGCRLSKWVKVKQACNHPTAWPFETVADSVASSEGDLVIHVGDYLYRETPCPDPAECGTVWGLNWASWEADWFTPARTLNSKRPLFLTRGNHEDCVRSWRGWYRYFSPNAYADRLVNGACNNHDAPISVNFDNFRLVMFDSSNISYNDIGDKLDFDQLPKATPGLATWFVTHRPAWAAYNAEPYKDYSYAGDTPLRTAYQNASQTFRDAMQMMVAGHVHIGQAILIPGSPTQLIIGNGGTSLNPFGQPYDYSGSPFTEKDVTNVPGFGFAVFDFKSNSLVFRNLHGTAFSRVDMNRTVARPATPK